MNKFNVGDKVVRINYSTNLNIGGVYEVSSVVNDTLIRVKGSGSSPYNINNFRLAQPVYNSNNPLSKERILDAISVIKEVNGNLPPNLWITIGKSLIKQGVITGETPPIPIEDVPKVDRLIESLMSYMNKNKEKAKLQKDLDDLMSKAEEIKEQIKGM